MDPRQIGQFLADLPEERIAKYRLRAAHARESANSAKFQEVKDAYTAMAAAWDALVVEYQRALEGIQELHGPSPEPRGFSVPDH